MSPAKARLLAAGGLLAYLLVLLSALPSAPLTDDDDFYIPAGAAYAEWLTEAWRDDQAWTRASIDAAFEPNHEHPPVAKYVFGLSGRWFGGILGPVAGPRVGAVLFSLLAAASLMWMATEALGPTRGTAVGLFAIACLLALPRWFFHSRVATLDVPVAGMVLLCAALALRAERSPWAAVALGPAFGLATATKLNAPFFVLPYLVFALVRRRLARPPPGSPRSIALPYVPLGAFSMAILGPLTFFLVWPWMWFDLAERVAAYVSFHLKHYGIYFLYFGERFEKDPFAPWTMPFVMAGLTVPVGLVILGFAGAALGGLDRRTRTLAGWAGLNALGAILPVALSGGAKYGGAKLFMPFFPFWCLLAALGAVLALEALSRRWKSSLRWSLPVLLLVPLSGTAQLVRYGATPLSQYNALAGGLRGATALGFERQYYDLAFHDLVDFLNRKGPPELKVHFLPNNWEYVRTFKWYAREGRLRNDIRVVRSEAAADWVVLTHERRFPRYAGDLIRARRWAVVHERRQDGVPLWTVLNPRGGGTPAAPPPSAPGASR